MPGRRGGARVCKGLGPGDLGALEAASLGAPSIARVPGVVEDLPPSNRRGRPLGGIQLFAKWLKRP